MQKRRLRVLTISELFPDASRPAFGIFVAHQVAYLRPATQQVVLVPWRVFPPREVFRDVRQWVPRLALWLRRSLSEPVRAGDYGATVIWKRYTSPPRPLVHGSWGYFAYGQLHGTLVKLRNEYTFDLIHAHYAVPSGTIALLAKRWMRVPVVLSVHGMDLTFTVRQDPLSAAVVRWVFRHADAIIANSSWTAQQIIELGGPPEKVRVVHLGADPPPELPLVPRVEGEPFRILSVGYLEPRKGHAFVLRALAKLHAEGLPFRYTVVGGGPELEPLQTLAGQLGIGAFVTFEGTKSHSETWKYYASADVFVLPSWSEAFGVVFIEALSLGVPVIGCKGQGFQDLQAYGDCLELVEPRDADGLAKGLRRLLQDPALRRRLGETGRRIVREHYSWENTARETLAIYQRVLAATTGFSATTK